MKPEELKYSAFSSTLDKQYGLRAPDFSKRFLKWFLENIFRLDEFETDDSCVDAKHDKGIDAIYVDDVSESIFIIQSKTKTNDKAELGDTELKDFAGTLLQLDSKTKIEGLINETKNIRLKQALQRNSVAEKVDSGYDLRGVFITNVPQNSDAKNYLTKVSNIELYDANIIAQEYVDLEIDGGISEKFSFDISDSDVIEYDAGGAASRLFLAPALNLIKMKGISDGSLFEQNVRLSLGNTKVNKSIKESIRQKAEHGNFPLYHNGINVLCGEITAENAQTIEVQDYVVVNGAQSLTSLLAEKAKITDDLKILVKLIEVKGNITLSQKITRNSNNQNAIKSRDLKSNHNIQQRLKAEVEKCSGGKIAYEIKQGEKNKGKEIIPNENAGLVILAADLDQPWSCHQKYRIMDELHSDIFGRPSVTGPRVIALWKCFQSVKDALAHIENASFANYTLTRYFLLYAVMGIIKDDTNGASILSNIDKVVEKGRVNLLVKGFSELAAAAANDLNAEIATDDDEYFDYKNLLKSQKWSKSTAHKMLTQYKKDVLRKKADPIGKIFEGILK
jgi:hypothetical protein